MQRFDKVEYFSLYGLATVVSPDQSRWGKPLLAGRCGRRSKQKAKCRSQPKLWSFMLYIHNLPSISAMAAPALDSDFAKDLRDLHLVYDYNVQDAHGNPDKWRYEIWFFSEVCEISLFLPPVPAGL